MDRVGDEQPPRMSDDEKRLARKWWHEGKTRWSGAGPVEGRYSTYGHHTANISRPDRAHTGPTQGPHRAHTGPTQGPHEETRII